MGMRFGSLNVRRMYRAGSLKAVASDLAKCNIQEVGWLEGGIQLADEYTFSVERRMVIITYGQAYLYIRESCQCLGGWKILVTGRRVQH
jgi:hypothetical protein